MTFPSDEWLARWVELANDDPEFRRAGMGWSGSVGCVVKQREDGPRRTVHWLLTGNDGQWTDYRSSFEAQITDPARFVLTAPRAEWCKILRQEIGPFAAIAAGHVRISGQLSSVLRWAQALVEMARLAGLVDTDFDRQPRP
ncbi:hypothetical protein [Microlunatus ginsengisoli]|uniref:hypothetical protein n=1 Tax=Microlunatus ginsengisoli TaxID=363863 RepID=UPI0031D92FEE